MAADVRPGDEITLSETYGAHNYAPLEVALVRAQGTRVWDGAGREYLDMLGAYSAVSLGHCHPRLIAALTRQAETLDTVSRAFYAEPLGRFLETACKTFGFDAALPMNSGAEAVETALKAARRWGYHVKGIPDGRAQIIACEGNFHGRTIAITGFSSVEEYKEGFGPFAPGFSLVPFGDADALDAAITPDTAAFLVEPIQGEGGIVIPPAGYLARCAEICRKHNVLLICDEIQTGLARTGALLACNHENVQPDVVTLGKALGGGLMPVSLVLARREVMDVFTPGSHGSTFGGNPLAAAVGLAALAVLEDEGLVERSARLGADMLARLQTLRSPMIREIRGKGLFIAIELDDRRIAAHEFCDRLVAHGVLTKDTHRNVVRLAPPLTVAESEIDTVIARVADTLKECEADLGAAAPA